MNHPFKAGGALLADSTVYIERKADSEALAHLRNMAYLLVIEPRQQGKTSLINHLMCHPALGDVVFAYVDVTTPDRSTEAAWYQTLCPRTLRQLRGFIPRDQWPTIPQNSAGWREFLCDVAMLATDARRLVVVALDEIGAVTFPGATEFFSVLRDVYNSRQAETELKQLTFLLAGAFHPRDLIKDDKISPFNIAQRVRMDDFTPTQVRELIGKGGWSEEQSAALAESIYYWTDGQPYLTQLLCSYLEPDAMPVDVDAAVERVRREDENHLPPMLERLNSDEKLCEYVERILAGEHIKFYPRENRRQAQLELLGVIKADTKGFCIIRNRMYVRALAHHDVHSLKVPQVLLDFTSAQSLVEQEWEPYGSEAENVRLTLEYDTALGKLVLAKKGQGFDAAVRYKPPNAPPLKWGCSHYELLVRMHPESIICIRVLDETGEERTLLYSSAILSGLNQWEEFHVPLGKDASDGAWHSLLIDLPEHMEQAQWPGFVMVNWLSLRGEVSLAGIRGCDDKDSLMASATVPSYIVRFASMANRIPGLGVAVTSQRVIPMSFPELAEALRRRTLALFIGADLPCEVTGLPSRADLARELARRKGLDETLSLAEVAQRVSQAGNRWEFTDFVRNALNTAGKSPQPFHRRIVELVRTHHIETLITTAYDHLLELAFREAGVPFNRVVRGSDVNFINPDRPTLIKLYGDAQQPDTLVVTDRDHSDLLRDRDKEPLVDEVRRVFRRNTVLFLGYNLADPDFRFLFDQIAESRFARTACAVWPGLPEADVRMWRDRGIVILDVDPLGIPGKFEAPSAPGGRPELAIALPASELSIGGKDMDYERGLDVLKQFAEGSDWYDDFDLYEARLCENLRDERRYGPSEQSRRDRARTIDHLNALVREHLDISFNDLCMGKLPRVERLDKAAGEDITALIQELKALVIEANAADREASERLWQAVQQGRVEQGEKGDGEAPATTEIYGTGKRWAVLIGVNEYVDKANYGRLHVCVKDVHAIREKFIAGGFEPARIRLLADGTSELPTRDNILVALKAVADATEPDDLLLFYYSGHGDEDEGESYLVARNGRRLVLSDTAVRVSRVKEIMEQAPARAKVIVLDACHSGADIGGKGPKPMSAEFIRRVFEQAEGLAILASCKQGQVSYEWRAQERSVFTHFLLEALEGQADRDEKDFVTVQDTNRHVTNGVRLWASQHNVSQIPTLQTAVAGDIILVRHQ